MAQPFAVGDQSIEESEVQMEKIRLLTATRKQTKEVSNRNPFLCTSLSSPSLNSLIILIKMKSANDRDGREGLMKTALYVCVQGVRSDSNCRSG